MTKQTTDKTIAKLKSGNTDLAHRENRIGQGSENVSASDMSIPRLKLLQALSPELDAQDPKFVEGAKAGQIINSVTNELSNGLFLINLSYSRATIAWKKRKAGGGMFGTYDTEAEALAAIKAAGEPEENFDIKENPTHLVYLLSDEGEPKGIALLDMPGTKIKVSKRWNTLIHEEEKEGNPRFGCVWQLSAVQEKNSDGPYNNYAVSLVARAPDEVYQMAAQAYDVFFGKEPLEEVDEAA